MSHTITAIDEWCCDKSIEQRLCVAIQSCGASGSIVCRQHFEFEDLCFNCEERF
jgi:hypothetical protein